MAPAICVLWVSVPLTIGPAINFLTADHAPSRTYTVQVMDMAGRVVYAEQGLEGAVTIDISRFTTGVYSVTAHNAMVKVTATLVRE